MRKHSLEKSGHFDCSGANVAQNQKFNVAQNQKSSLIGGQMKGRVYQFSLFRTYNFQIVTGCAEKRSSKFLRGFGFRAWKGLDRRNICADFLAVADPENPVLKTLHLLLLLFLLFSSLSFRKTMFVFFLFLDQAL